MGKQAVRVARIPVQLKGPIKAKTIELLMKAGYLPIFTVQKPGV